MRQNTTNSQAPSILAASSTSRLMPEKELAQEEHREGRHQDGRGDNALEGVQPAE